MPALHRYTGVLYDNLDVTSLRGASAARARARLAVGSALFGLLRADDPVPAYRLSASSSCPESPPWPHAGGRYWKPVLAELAAGELVVDLRSGSYAGLGRLPHAVTVDCLTEHPDGRRTVITHFNKAHKGNWRASWQEAVPNPTTPRRWPPSPAARGYMSSATAIR